MITKSRIHDSCRLYGINTNDRNCTILENVTLGYPSDRLLDEIAVAGARPESYPYVGVRIGDDAVIRPGSTIYCDVTIGNAQQTGHAQRTVHNAQEL